MKEHYLIQKNKREQMSLETTSIVDQITSIEMLFNKIWSFPTYLMKLRSENDREREEKEYLEGLILE